MMQNRGLSIFVIVIASIVSSVFISSFDSGPTAGIDYDYTGKVIEVNDSGVVLTNDGVIESVALTPDEKGTVYVNEVIAVVAGEVYPLVNEQIGYTDDYHQIVTGTGAVVTSSLNQIKIDNDIYLIEDTGNDFQVGQTIFYLFFENKQGYPKIIVAWDCSEISNVMVKRIGRDENGCMVINGRYVINQDTIMGTDIVDIKVLDNYQLCLNADDSISYIGAL